MKPRQPRISSVRCTNLTKKLQDQLHPIYGTCKGNATTFRKDFRWGKQGEPTIVNIKVPLCAMCARMWDDNKAEGRAEARAS